MRDDQMHQELASLDDRTRSLRRVDLTELETMRVPAQQYAVGVWLPYMLLTLLSAHGGAGKSLLALVLAAHYACGRSWGEFAVGIGRAIYVSLEDSIEVCIIRLQEVCRVYQLPHALVAQNLTILDGSESDGALFIEGRNLDGNNTLLPTSIWDELQEEASGHRLIVVDNASDAFGGNENDRRQVRAFCRHLSLLAKQNNAALLLLAHIDKAAARNKDVANGQTFSGSTAWHNSARSRIALIPDGDDVLLVHEKLNGGLKADPMPLQWQADGMLIPLRTEGAYAYQLTANESDDTDVLTTIKAAAVIGHSVNSARGGNSTTWHSLQTIASMPKWAKVHSAKPRFWAAINRLMDAGTIAEIEYRNAERKLKKRLEVRQ